MGFLDENGLTRFWNKLKLFMVGDGLSDKNGLSVTNPVRGILTKAEFDALSEEEKATGTYFVDDGSSSSSGGGSSSEDYSTEETVIGTWIDGKKLYRRVFAFTTPSNYSLWTNVGVAVENIDYLAETVITFISSDGAKIQCPFRDNASTIEFCYKSNGIEMYLNHTGGDYFKSRPARAILLYTKTTDEATVTTNEISAPTNVLYTTAVTSGL